MSKKEKPLSENENFRQLSSLIQNHILQNLEDDEMSELVRTIEKKLQIDSLDAQLKFILLAILICAIVGEAFLAREILNPETQELLKSMDSLISVALLPVTLLSAVGTYVIYENEKEKIYDRDHKLIDLGNYMEALDLAQYSEKEFGRALNKIVKEAKREREKQQEQEEARVKKEKRNNDVSRLRSRLQEDINDLNDIEESDTQEMLRNIARRQ